MKHHICRWPLKYLLGRVEASNEKEKSVRGRNVARREGGHVTFLRHAQGCSLSTGGEVIIKWSSLTFLIATKLGKEYFFISCPRSSLAHFVAHFCSWKIHFWQFFVYKIATENETFFALFEIWMSDLHYKMIAYFPVTSAHDLCRDFTFYHIPSIQQSIIKCLYLFFYQNSAKRVIKNKSEDFNA